jgi:AraC-like DNA-binding protein
MSTINLSAVPFAGHSSHAIAPAPARSTALSTRSDEPTTATIAAARLFASHQLTSDAARTPLRFELDAIDVADMTVARVSYGSAVRIRSDGLDGKLAISMPRTQPVSVHRPGGGFECGPECAWVLAAGEPVTIATGARHDAVSVVVPIQMVEDHLRRLLGTELRRPLMFASEPSQSPWLRVAFASMSSLMEQSDAQRLVSPIVTSQIKDLFLTTLLLNHPNNYLDDLTPPGEPGSPRVVRRVREAITDAPEYPWTMTELAEAAGASVRSVQVNFRKHVGCTPFEMLRVIRLERAHADLSDPGPGDTVTSICMRWGFSNMGRFASAYRRRYGISPHETLTSSH